MDHTAKWMRTDGEGIPPVDDTERGIALGLSPRAAALAVIILLGLVTAGVYFTGFSGGLRRAAAHAPYPHEVGRVTFAIAGDVIPHEPVRAAAEAAGGGTEGWGTLLGNVSDVFEGVNYGFVNLETPVAPEHSKGSKPFMFDAPVALPQALKANGVKIVSFANNHVMDQGWAGFAETRNHLREIGLQFVGSGDTAAQTWQPLIVETNGIKVGWLGMTRWLNGNRNPEKDDQPHVNFFPYPGEAGGAAGADDGQVLEAVKAAKAQCDLLVISVHWGTEYAPAPRPEDVETAHKMLNAGASVIVGHHPHVLQPIETYTTTDGRMTVIFYSLGNFLSNQSRNYVDRLMPDKDGDPRDSMIGLFSVVRNDYGPGGMRVDVEHVGMMPAWGENNRNALAAGKAKTPNIHPVLIDREIPKAQAKLDELNKAAQDGGQLSAEQKQEFIEATNRLKVLTDRRTQILARTGDEYVIDPPKATAKP